MNGITVFILRHRICHNMAQASPSVLRIIRTIPQPGSGAVILGTWYRLSFLLHSAIMMIQRFCALALSIHTPHCCNSAHAFEATHSRGIFPMRRALDCSSPSGQPQFAIEGLGVGLPAEEVLEGLHLILAAAALEDSVAVASAFFGIHGIFRKHGEKHVCRVHLRTAHKEAGTISTATVFRSKR